MKHNVFTGLFNIESLPFSLSVLCIWLCILFPASFLKMWSTLEADFVQLWESKFQWELLKHWGCCPHVSRKIGLCLISGPVICCCCLWALAWLKQAWEYWLFGCAIVNVDVFDLTGPSSPSHYSQTIISPSFSFLLVASPAAVASSLEAGACLSLPYFLQPLVESSMESTVHSANGLHKLTLQDIP